MTPEAQRMAIAEACGKFTTSAIKKEHLRWDSQSNGAYYLGHFSDGSIRPCYSGPLPDYLNDLNAMHEAEKVLNKKQQVWYLQKLTQVRFKSGVSGMIDCMIDKTTFASAAQRAEAFLKTIGKWTS